MTEIVKLSKKDIDNILTKYTIGTYVSHKHIPWALGNSVYYLNTSNGKFILKIHQDIKLSRLKFVLNTMEFARSKGIPVPEIIQTKTGRLISKHNKEMVTIQKYIEGKEIKISKISTIKNTARTIGLLDKALLKIPLKKKSGRKLSRKLVYDSIKVKGFNFIEQEKQLRKNLRKINTRKLTRGVIHSDIGSANLLYNNKRVTAILDWDDTNESYLVYELAVILSYGFTTKNRILKNNIKQFLKEYQKYIKLNEDEKKALYYMILSRQLSAASWVARQLKIRKNKHDEGLKKLLNSYRLFNKSSLVEFLTWINK
jgi:homoserine kinase type II